MGGAVCIDVGRFLLNKVNSMQNKNSIGFAPSDVLANFKSKNRQQKIKTHLRRLLKNIAG